MKRLGFYRVFTNTHNGFFPSLLAGLLVAGCSLTPTLDTWQTPDATAIADWRLSGRVSLTREEQGWHARLVWQEQGENFLLKVAGPLGQGRFQLSGDGQGVVLKRGNGKMIKASNADRLVQKVTGWNLPVTGLRYWVRGLPVPGIPSKERRDLQGRLVELTQSGWAINYKSYKLVDGIGWPEKLRLVSENLTVRMMIEEWESGAVETASDS